MKKKKKIVPKKTCSFSHESPWGKTERYCGSCYEKIVIKKDEERRDKEEVEDSVI